MAWFLKALAGLAFESFGPSLLKFSLYTMVTMAITGVGCNSLHSWKSSFERRINKRRDYREGLDAGIKRCKEKCNCDPGKRDRWAWWPWRRISKSEVDAIFSANEVEILELQDKEGLTREQAVQVWQDTNLQEPPAWHRILDISIVPKEVE